MPSVNRSKIVLLACVGALGAGAGGVAFAQGASAAQAIKTRQSNLKDLGAAVKTVRDELRKSAPDMAQVKQASSRIATLSTQMSTWFPQGSGPESKLETAAKAEIWSDPQGFQAAMNNFKAQAPKTQQLADANDIAGLKAHVGQLGAACKGCHDKYRVPQD